MLFLIYHAQPEIFKKVLIYPIIHRMLTRSQLHCATTKVWVTLGKMKYLSAMVCWLSSLYTKNISNEMYGSASCGILRKNIPKCRTMHFVFVRNCVLKFQLVHKSFLWIDWSSRTQFTKHMKCKGLFLWYFEKNHDDVEGTAEASNDMDAIKSARSLTSTVAKEFPSASPKRNVKSKESWQKYIEAWEQIRNELDLDESCKIKVFCNF